ncbi:hypothetical protein TIFTF001_030027 [Ficus carica]|uniref:Uncharacterized protein n=1 Tax=Ficus carica TaxID=3494 RepID=A0AA88DSY9_FICCA|nr:hypothetical protein TIFTF001_030027 [Ficus carica]
MLQRSPSQGSCAPLDRRSQNPGVLSPEVRLKPSSFSGWLPELGNGDGGEGHDVGFWVLVFSSVSRRG